MKLVVGLGNPGKQYEQTKHNIGFMCLDYYANQAKESFKFERKFNGETLKLGNLVLLKPHTFMNLSGESIRLVMNYYDIDIDDVLVIYDDLDLPLGKLRLREQGGPGGHNGIKSIIEQLKTNDFKRVRVGIDSNPMIEAKDYVLGRFTKDELDVIVSSAKQIYQVINEFKDNQEFTLIMNEYNKSP
ncbi:aminoacyl-tRNA hydrolase [Candidatus Xianfuyuplasma coldseepsis]|uniref:Peptidyl-tRNA hydrolase n=1 Tax=Candidatus Xianfuyuplasma coldseepsis TaxID=2782163 RepID=A0A7L7KQ70_9MOLU|nr:aminoacyl-tRNA hydrolase [Xianfuyuplasma coldseepsis]QMS84940.1 aminoacyl-tRNA hydrolase [Xianfuyuplasma coldseepsis]